MTMQLTVNVGINSAIGQCYEECYHCKTAILDFLLSIGRRIQAQRVKGELVHDTRLQQQHTECHGKCHTHILEITGLSPAAAHSIVNAMSCCRMSHCVTLANR